MKIKIKIAGPLVHEVGYRFFLMSNAIDMGLKEAFMPEIEPVKHCLKL
jgi:hypothetical protein